jgi:hypothetical protein
VSRRAIKVGIFCRSFRKENTTEMSGGWLDIRILAVSDHRETLDQLPYPSSSEYAGRNPVRSIFSFETM